MIAVEALFQREWPQFSLSETHHPAADLPPVLVSLVDGIPVGGLSYTRYPIPGGDQKVVWINALYVESTARGCGIAAALVRQAIAQMEGSSQSRLYVYTHLVDIYRRWGWLALDSPSEPGHCVMAISIAAKNNGD